MQTGVISESDVFVAAVCKHGVMVSLLVLSPNFRTAVAFEKSNSSIPFVP